MIASFFFYFVKWAVFKNTCFFCFLYVFWDLAISHAYFLVFFVVVFLAGAFLVAFFAVYRVKENFLWEILICENFPKMKDQLTTFFLGAVFDFFTEALAVAVFFLVAVFFALGLVVAFFFVEAFFLAGAFFFGAAFFLAAAAAYG